MCEIILPDEFSRKIIDIILSYFPDFIFVSFEDLTKEELINYIHWHPKWALTLLLSTKMTHRHSYISRNFAKIGYTKAVVSLFDKGFVVDEFAVFHLYMRYGHDTAINLIIRGFPYDINTLAAAVQRKDIKFVNWLIRRDYSQEEIELLFVK